MARSTPHTARPKHPAPVSSPIQNPSTTSQSHADFMQVTVHTAKCDSCEKPNKLTLYRCMECGQHVCSSCWTKFGDGTHVFGGGSRNVPEVNRNGVVRNNNGDSGKGHKDAGRTRSGRRVHVISDDEDDDLPAPPVLKPASTIGNVELIETTNQHQRSNNDITMDEEVDGHMEDDLPGLWPMASGNVPPVLRLTVPVANTSATESATQVMQSNPQIHAEELDPERQRTARVYENLDRQTASNRRAFVSDQETNLQAHRPSQSSISNQQTIRTAPPHAQPAIYRPRPGVDVDRQAARYQHLFAPSQPTNRQAPRPAQPSVAHQQIPRHLQPAIYRPRPGVDVDQQAARNQLAFAPVQNTHYQVYRPSQASVLYSQAAHPAQASASVSQRHVQIMANINQAGDRNLQAHAYAKAKQMESCNRQTLSSHPNTPPATDRDQVATHNQQAFISNQRSAATASYEQLLAARNQQLADLARMQMNRPALASDPYKGAHNSSRIPGQAFLTQQHAAHPADRQAQHRTAPQDHLNGPSTGIQIREYPPEVIEAADALLYYAGVDQAPRDRLNSDQDASGYPASLSTPGQLSSDSTESRSSSKTLVGGSEAAGAQSLSPHLSALKRTPSSTSTDSAKIRVGGYRIRLLRAQAPSGTRQAVSDLPARVQGHPHHRHAALQPESGTDSSLAPSRESSFRDAHSQPGSKLPISDHAATYINQWNSGRATLSSSSKSPAINVPNPQLNCPRSAFPVPRPQSAVDVMDTTADGSEQRENVEPGFQALRTPISMSGDPIDVDSTMGSPEIEILEDNESRRSKAWTPEKNPWAVGKFREAEKHPRGEKKDGLKTSKGHKASDDADIADARKRISKGEHAEQIGDDGADDFEITSWKKLDSNKTTEDHLGAYSKATGHKCAKRIRKGVAHVKKSEPKGRKVKTNVIHLG